MVHRYSMLTFAHPFASARASSSLPSTSRLFHTTSTTFNMPGDDSKPITAYTISSYPKADEQPLPGLDSKLKPGAEHTKVSAHWPCSPNSLSPLTFAPSLPCPLFVISLCPAESSPPPSAFPSALLFRRSRLSAGLRRESPTWRSTSARACSRARRALLPVATAESAAPPPSSSLAREPMSLSLTSRRRRRSEFSHYCTAESVPLDEGRVADP